MGSSSNDLVILEIQGNLLECNRKILIENSDYFKAMFEGNFVESSKAKISLKDIDLTSMNIILILLWDKEYVIKPENVLPVLQAASMLQFLEIKQICINQLLDLLSPSNCLKIWIYAEHLGLTKLHLKAKLLALMEFLSVKESDYLLELSLDQVVNYLGNLYLQCTDEMEVFKTMIKWYQNLGDKESCDVVKLLHCLDFALLTETEIEEIMNCQEFVDNEQVIQILQCIIATKNRSDNSHFKENCRKNAELLLHSKHRNLQGFPCILLENLGLMERQIEASDEMLDTTVLYYDKFKRKRKYNNLVESSSANLSVISIEPQTGIVRKIFDLDPQKLARLDGFKMTGYKHYVYLYGGEFLLGKGDWNITFYVYDVIKEKWKYVGLLPFKRRHFEACICGNYLFVVGGTGPFRVIQENIFWYNFDLKIWSKEERLPCSGRQIKCCSFDNKLFVLNINNKCGYMFCPELAKWTKLDICDNENVLPCYSQKLALFSYKTRLYIKGNKLYELKLEEDSLVITNQIILSELQKTTSEIESILCENVLYTLNKQWCEETNRHIISLESFNLDTYETSCNFQKTADEILEMGNEMFKFRQSLMICNAFHYSLLSENNLVNNFHYVE